MQTNAPLFPSEAQLLIKAAAKQAQALHEQGRYRESLDICLQIMRTYPDVIDAWYSAAVNCIRLVRWQDVIGYAQTELTKDNQRSIFGHDALALAHGMIGQWREARRYGLQALDMRDRQFGGEPVIPWPESELPQPPSAQTRERNLIAFSLFGGDSKYCETAVLNVQKRPLIYPYWVCRFYVDGSVPDHVISRLRAGGAQIVPVGAAAAQWPGPMWRFLALDDSHAHRILFRDADSLISQREAGAVQQWIASGKRFHVMRDWSSHTELMMAGLWGVVGGSLPPLEQLMQRFMSVPLESAHYADQDFLRQYVWPYARTSLMQHDSVFGFMDATPFPDGENPRNNSSVGYAEGSPTFSVKSNLPNGSEVTWAIIKAEKLDNGQTREELVCAYPGTVKNGAISAHIPASYARWIKQGVARLDFRAHSAL